MGNQEPIAAEAFAELKELLLLAASGGSPQRVAATRYTICRDTLFRSDLGSLMPGFLRQCLTIYRFHDFIHLYAPTLEERAQFVGESLRACDPRVGVRPKFDAFDDPDF